MQRFRLILPDEFSPQSQAENIPDIKIFIHQRIKIALQLGRIPWKVPVSHDPNTGLPQNVRTGCRYRGVNTLLLCDTYETKSYRSKWWGTVDEDGKNDEYVYSSVEKLTLEDAIKTVQKYVPAVGVPGYEVGIELEDEEPLEAA